MDAALCQHHSECQGAAYCQLKLAISYASMSSKQSPQVEGYRMQSLCPRHMDDSKLRNNVREDNVMPQPPVYEEVVSSYNLQNKRAHKRKGTHTPHLIV